MAHCPMCFHWNTPLMMWPVRVAESSYVPLSFGQWLLYRLHVDIHQKGNWAGEIEAYTNELLASHNQRH